MRKEIYKLTLELKELIDNDPRLSKLNSLEKRMNDDEEVMSLAYKKDMAAVRYSDTLNHFSEDSKEAKEALKELHLSKKNLDENPLVREYLNAYKEVRNLYLDINNILFSDLNAELCPKEK